MINFPSTTGVVTKSSYNTNVSTSVSTSCYEEEDVDGNVYDTCDTSTRTNTQYTDVEFIYLFTIDNQNYTSSSYSICIMNHSPSIIDDYPVGTNITVYYNKSDYSNAYVNNQHNCVEGIRFLGWIGVAGVVIFGFIMLAIVFSPDE